MKASSIAIVMIMGSLGCNPTAGGLGSGSGTPVDDSSGTADSGGTQSSTGPMTTGSSMTGVATTSADATSADTTTSDATTSDATTSGTTAAVDDATAGSTGATTGDGATTGPPPQSLPELDCAEEGMVQSIDAMTSADITFHNESGAVREVFWLDYGGARSPYATIQPGNTWMISTYVTHPWLIADDAGTCLTIFVTEAGSHDIFLY